MRGIKKGFIVIWFVFLVLAIILKIMDRISYGNLMIFIGVAIMNIIFLRYSLAKQDKE